MKKILLALAAATISVSCSKTDIQQTQSTMKSADSLFKSANEGFKTLDSISAIVNDSAKFNRVVVPQIEKTKKDVEKSIRVNAKNLDSLSHEIDKIKNTVSKSADIAKTVDSANKKLQQDGSIFEKIGTITGTIGKISKQSQKSNSSSQNNAHKSAENKVDTNQDYTTTIQQDPITKKASLEINVADLQVSRDRLKNQIQTMGGDVVTENFNDAEGVKKQYILVKIPLKNFDDAVNQISDNYGFTTAKAIESEGTEYRASQMSDIAITFVQDKSSAMAPIPPSTNNSADDNFKSKSSDAFKKGANGFSDVLVMLIPFWPLLIVAGLVWYFVSRNNKKRREEEFQRQVQLEALRKQNQRQSDFQPTQENQAPENPAQIPPENPKNDDYTRFMPK